MANILIVDDSSTVRDLLGYAVRSAGHEPVFATDGTESLAAAEQCRPALILMDIVMPGQDGFASVRALKKNAETAGIPVVMVSTKTAPSDKFWGKKQGADDHIDKPFTPDKIAAVIQRYVR